MNARLRAIAGTLRETALEVAGPWRRLSHLSALPSAEASDVLSRVAHQQFRAVLGNSLGLLWAHAIAVVLHLIVMSSYRPLGWPGVVGWAAAATTTTLAMFVMLIRFSRQSPPDAALPAWERRCAALNGASGLVWGLAVVPALNDPFVTPYTALGLLLVMMAALSLQSIYRPAIWWQVLPCAVVSSICFLLRGGWFHVVATLVYVLLLVLLIKLARRQNAVVTQFMRTSEERLALLEAVEAQRAAAQRANQEKTRFLAAVSHDLCHPTHSMALLTQALRQPEQDRPAVVEQFCLAVKDMNEMLDHLGQLAAREDASSESQAPLRDAPWSPPAAGSQAGTNSAVGERSRTRLTWGRVAGALRRLASDVVSPWRPEPATAMDTPEVLKSISHQQLRGLLDKGHADARSALVYTTLGAMMLWAMAPGAGVLVWGLCQFVVIAATELNYRRYVLAKPSDEMLRPWEAQRGRLASVQGVLWGSVWFLFPWNVYFESYAVLGLLWVTAGSVRTHHRPALSWLAVPCAAMTCVGLLAQGSMSGLVMGLGFALAVGVMIGLGWVQSELVTRSMQLAQERILLMDELEGQRAAAQQADAAKTRFLSTVSHDLRQPMYAITLLSGSLRQQPNAPAPVLQQMDASVQAMGEMLDALLEVSRLDEGTLPLRVAPLALAPLLDRIELQFVSQAQSKGLTLRVQPPASRWRLVSDAYQLQRVVANLVANAIRYTPHGQVIVRCRLRHKLVWLQVWDTGVGIARDDRQRIFQEFVQLSAAQSGRREGLGLGLSIVQRLTSRLNHPVVLRSRPGRGSMFAVGVPLDGTDAGTDSMLDAQEEQALLDLLRDKLILLIDSDAAALHSLQSLLETFHCNVLVAPSTALALEAVNSSLCTPDCIISDLELGNGDTGLNAIAQLRALVGHPLPALLLTAQTGPTTLAAQGSGITVLAKPLHAQALWHALSKTFQA